MVGPYPDALNYWGGKNAYYILNNQEYWRLLSPIMLHAGVFHLLCNVAVQLDTGAFWEREWGSFIWLVVYLVSAIWGSILSVIVMPNTVGVGSSGSVCGLFGAKMAEAFCRMCESQKSEQAKLSHDILCEQFGTTLCSVILILAFSFIPYVDWAAHVGGLIGGYAVGMLLFSCYVKTWRWRIIWFLTGFLMTAVGLVLGVVYMHEEIKGNVADEMKDVCGYYEDYFQGQGIDYECNCMLEDQ
jgi:membrane associated rhomboid family serine protease